MSLKYTLPEATSIRSFFAAKNLDTGGLDAAIGLATNQFIVNEQIKEYSAGIEKSSMYIGMDVERLLAVDTGLIKIGIAKDRAAYKTALASAVKDVRIQQAHLEGQFGVDAAAVKKEFSVKGFNLNSSLDEETQTFISSVEYTSTAKIALDEKASNIRLNTSEDAFRRGLSDIDYEASVIIADTRATNIKARGLTDKTAIEKESAVTDQGLFWAYDIEAGGIQQTSITEVGLIQEQGSAERTNMYDVSSIKIEGIYGTSQVEIESSNTISYNRILMLAEQGSMQADVAKAVSETTASNIRQVGQLEAAYIGIDAAAQDEAYNLGAATDMRVDAARYDAEANSIRELAVNKVSFATKLADAEGQAKLVNANAEGKANLARAITEGANEVAISLSRATNQKTIAGIRSDALYEVANRQAQVTRDVTQVSIDQIAADSESEIAHVSAMSVIDVDRYTQVQQAEIDAGVAESGLFVSHNAALTTSSDLHLNNMGKEQARYITESSNKGVQAAIDRYTEEARFITKESENRVLQISGISDSTLSFIAESAAGQAASTRNLADIAYSSAVSTVDTEFSSSINKANILNEISIGVASWASQTEQTVASFVRGIQYSRAQLARYAVSHSNYYTVSDTTGTSVEDGGREIDLPQLEGTAGWYEVPKSLTP